MKLRKILVAGLLFVAAGMNVMAGDPYDDFGGRNVKVADLLPKLAMRKSSGTQYDLTLSTEMYKKFKKNIVASEFSHMEKLGGKVEKPVSQYLFRFVKGIYDALETAAVEGKVGLPLPDGADEDDRDDAL